MTIKQILKMNSEELKTALSSNSLTVCVVGIGRIGLPTALSFANSGLFTIGLDINSELVKNINSGIYPLKDEPEYDKIFEKVISTKKFVVTTNIDESVSKADIIILALPTPMDSNNIPDYSILRSVGSQLSDYLPEDSLIIVESTIEPGFIENELISIIEGSSKRLNVNKNFGMGVCPETANPGEIMVGFTKLPRLVAGVNSETTQLIYEIYKFVFPVELIKMPNCKTANAVKLITNIFRDINIAFVNELSIFFERLGIDTFAVLEAAKSKYNFQIHYPGAGVGGPCLPVNSYQLLNSAKILGNDNMLSIIKTCRKVNENMPQHVIELIQNAFSESNRKLGNATIMVLGISYKPNIKDIQWTPAELIIKKLRDLGVNIRIFDPFYKNERIFDITVENDLFENLSDCDGMVIITKHDEFSSLNPELLASKMKFPIVVDTRGLISKDSAKKAGLVFRGLGQ